MLTSIFVAYNFLIVEEFYGFTEVEVFYPATTTPCIPYAISPRQVISIKLLRINTDMTVMYDFNANRLQLLQVVIGYVCL